MSVTIGADSFDTYGSAAGLATYANGSLAYAAIFAAAEDDDAARALVEATRVLDRQAWNGTKTSDAQSLAWPRTGVTRTVGAPAAVDPNAVPVEITAAAYELALAGLADPALFTVVSTAKNIKKLDAKGASIEYFGPAAGGRWPGRVGELVGQFLAGMGASTLGSSAAYGTSDCSDFDDDDRYGVTGPG